jgi:hypothetical protein
MPKSKEELVQDMRMAKLFQEPIVAEFFETTQQKIFERWRNTPPEDTKEREVLYVQTLGMESFRQFLRMKILVGKEAERELKEKYEKEVAAIDQSNRK